MSNHQDSTYAIVDITEIYIDDTFNVRGTMGIGDYKDLIDSFKVDGQLAPVFIARLRPDNPLIATGVKFKLLAGFRRINAARHLEWPTIKAMISEPTDEVSELLVNLKENLKRRDPNIVQEARQIAKLKALGLTETQVAGRLKVSAGWVSIRFAILRMPEDAQAVISEGKIPATSIKELSQIYTAQGSDGLMKALKKIKTQMAKGAKIGQIVLEGSVKNQTDRKRRLTDREVDKLLEYLAGCESYSLANRALAVVAGNISLDDFFNSLRNAGVFTKPDNPTFEGLMSKTEDILDEGRREWSKK